MPLLRDRVASHDSVQVERLRAAGAIVVGKTNAPEFGYTAITKNLLFGVTRSPWNLERTPGGSSGGSAAAIAGVRAAARHRERRRRLDPHPGELHRLLRPEAVLRPHAARAARALGLRRHGGLRPAHQDGRGRRALPRLRSPAPRRTIRTACPPPGLSYLEAAPRRRSPAGCASASRPISATRSCSPTSRRRSRTRARVFEKLGHRLGRDRRAARRSSAASGGCSAPSSSPRTSTSSCPRARRDFGRALPRRREDGLAA